MELKTVTRFLALLSSVLLALMIVPVQGGVRCSGKWKIHACYGGNGKRTIEDLNPLTVASREREARQQAALQKAVRAEYPRTLSLIDQLKPDVRRETPQSISDRLFARELVNLLQEENLPRQKEVEPILEPLENDVVDGDFSLNDVTNDEAEMTSDDMETVRDIITALTLKQALRTDGLTKGNRDTRDQML